MGISDDHSGGLSDKIKNINAVPLLELPSDRPLGQETTQPKVTIIAHWKISFDGQI